MKVMMSISTAMKKGSLSFSYPSPLLASLAGEG
jgi:hypothetical protein